MSAVDHLEPGLPLPKPKLSNAERQRRYRNAKRNAPERNARNGVTPRNADDRNEDRNARNADDEGAAILCPNQFEVSAAFNDGGDLILRQSNWPDDDSVIIVRCDNIPEFIDRLTDVLGIPSSRG